MRIRHGSRSGRVPGSPLERTRWAFCQLPFKTEQVVQEVVVPLHRIGGPGTLQPAADGVDAFAGAEGVFPAEALLLDRRGFGQSADIFVRIGGAVGFTERVPAGDQGDRLRIIHRHAGERLADVPRRGDRVRLSVRSFRVDVDQTHLNGAKGTGELAVATVALVAKPLALMSPLDALFGYPDNLSPAGETERLEAHRFQGNVTRENHQVGP